MRWASAACIFSRVMEEGERAAPPPLVQPSLIVLATTGVPRAMRR